MGQRERKKTFELKKNLTPVAAATKQQLLHERCHRSINASMVA